MGIIEKVMNDGSIGSTFNEGMMKVEGETAYCVDINTNFQNGYKTRADASTRMSADQIADVALVSVGRFSPFRVGLKTPISVNLKSPMHHVCY